jgi:hypothetical protein
MDSYGFAVGRANRGLRCGGPEGVSAGVAVTWGCGAELARGVLEDTRKEQESESPQPDGVPRCEASGEQVQVGCTRRRLRARRRVPVSSKPELGARPEASGSAPVREAIAGRCPSRCPMNPWPCPAEPASSGRGHTSIITPAHGPTATPSAPVSSSSTARSFSGCVAVRLPAATPHDDSALPRRPAPSRDLPRHGRGRRPQRLGGSFLGRARLPGIPSVRDPGPRIRSDPVRLLRT